MPGSSQKIEDIGSNPVGRPNLKDREFLIFRELNYDKAVGEFYFSRKDKRTGWAALKGKFGTIDNLIQNIEEYNNLQIAQEDKKNDETSKLAIAVRAPSYIVLSISRELPWSFGGDGQNQSISIGNYKNSTYKDNFSDVRHYNANGSVTAAVGSGCTLIALSVDPLLTPDPHADPYNDQPINFHLVDAGGTAITVDPDIRYPGNSGAEIDPPPIVIIPVDEPQP